jgi:hypothetical protein
MRASTKVFRSSVVLVLVLCWVEVGVLAMEVRSGQKILGQSLPESKKVVPKSKKVVPKSKKVVPKSKKVVPKSKKVVPKQKPVKPVPYIPPVPKHPPKFKNGQLYKPPKPQPKNPTKKQILALKAKA